MKKNFLMAALLVAATVSFAQDSTRRFEVGLGAGFGAYTDALSVMNATINLDADYYFSPILSLFGHVDYNRSFAPGEANAGSFGFATTHVGPRVHFGKVFFLGVGAGTAFFTGDGSSSWIMSYYPQIGINTKGMQFGVDYKVLANQGTSLGILEIGAVFKIHHAR